MFSSEILEIMKVYFIHYYINTNISQLNKQVINKIKSVTRIINSNVYTFTKNEKINNRLYYVGIQNGYVLFIYNNQKYCFTSRVFFFWKICSLV